MMRTFAAVCLIAASLAGGPGVARAAEKPLFVAFHPGLMQVAPSAPAELGAAGAEWLRVRLVAAPGASPAAALVLQAGDGEVVRVTPEQLGTAEGWTSDFLAGPLLLLSAEATAQVRVESLEAVYLDRDSAEARRAEAEQIFSQLRAAESAATGTPKPDPDAARKIIYGNDDRVEPSTVTDPRIQALVNATVAIVSRSQLTTNGDGTYRLSTTAWTTQGGTLCSDEPFRGQPVAANCSGYLVGSDIIMTAGHCMNAGNVTSWALIFNYQMKPDGSAPDTTAIPADRVYFPTTITNQALSGNLDHCIARLDRPVQGRVPLQIRRSGEVSLNTPLIMVGHPRGLPMKVAGGATVKAVRSSDPYFQANTDSYGGNSGSLVANAETFVVEGILVRGAADFRTRSGASCIESNRVPDTGAGGTTPFEEVTKTAPIASFVPTTRATFVLSGDVFSPTSAVQVAILDSDGVGRGPLTASARTAARGPVSFSLSETEPGRFVGTLQLSPNDPAGAPATLQVAGGERVTFSFLDQTGPEAPYTITQDVLIDGVKPRATSITTSAVHATRASVLVEADEAARVTVRAGIDCDNLNLTFSTTKEALRSVVELTGLAPSTTYFYEVELTDAAGNTSDTLGDDSSFSFTTQDSARSYTELTTTAEARDLVGSTVVFRPSTPGNYAICVEPASGFSVDPSSHASYSLTDDGSSPQILLPFPFPFAGSLWDGTFINANGNVTFASASNEYLGTRVKHFLVPRISALLTDLNPPAGGSIRGGAGGPDTFAFTWQDVRYFNSTSAISAQIVLRRDGEVRITTLRADTTPKDFVTGLSFGWDPGSAAADEDFSAALNCSAVTPSPTPSPTPLPTETSSPSPSVSPTPSLSPSPSATISPSASPTTTPVTATVTASPSPSTTVTTPTLTGTATPTPSPSRTPTPSPSPSPSLTPSPSPSPSASPTPFLPTDSVGWGFNASEEGWTYAMPSPFCGLVQRVEDGSLGVELRDSALAFAFWESPLLPIKAPGSSAAGLTGGTGESWLYRVEARLRSDKENPVDVPTIRLRTSTEDFQLSHLQGITSTNNGLFSPATGGYTYTHLFKLPAGHDSVRMNFDLLAGDATDPLPAAVFLDYWRVDSLGAAALTDARQELLLDLTGPDAAAWLESRVEPAFTAPAFQRDAEGLGLRAGAPAATVFGYWRSPDSGLPVSFVPGRVYRFDFLMTSSGLTGQRSTLPTFRLRMNDVTFRANALVNVESQGSEDNLPASGRPVEYSVFFVAPPELEGSKPLLAFDLIYTPDSGNDPALTVALRRVRVQSFAWRP